MVSNGNKLINSLTRRVEELDGGGAGGAGGAGVGQAYLEKDLINCYMVNNVSSIMMSSAAAHTTAHREVRRDQERQRETKTEEREETEEREKKESLLRVFCLTNIVRVCCVRKTTHTTNNSHST